MGYKLEGSMCCCQCGKTTAWIDRFGRCRECAPDPLDVYATELLPAGMTRDLDGDLVVTASRTLGTS